jgi:amino acid adenylation domain-containing protein
MQDSNEKFSTEQVSFDPFGPTIKSAPSTEAQREIFTSVKIGGAAANCAYNESVLLHFDGLMDIDKLNKAYHFILDRFDSLRAKFSEDGETIIISDEINSELTVIDLSSEEPEVSAQLVQDIKREEVFDAFDLSNGPLIRLKILLLKENTSSIIITAHHIICDGWSLSLLIQDLSKYYSSLINGTQVAFPKALSFLDYAITQNNYQKSISCVATEKFWVDQYKNDIPVLEFPTDKKRPALRTFNAKRTDITVPIAVVKKLRELSKKTGTSFVTLVLASFETFLHKVTGQNEIVVGLPSAGQNVDGIYNLVGHCVNLLPLRSNVDDQLGFSDYLKQRRTYIFDAYDNQQFTFGSLVRKLNVARDPSRIPLVPIIFNIDIGFSDAFKFEGLNFEFESNPRYYENFEIFLNAMGSGDNLVLECTYNTDLFEEDSMIKRIHQFIGVMQSIVANPSITIQAIQASSDNDIALLTKMNDTAIQYPDHTSIYELFRENSLLSSDKIAITGSKKQYTYSEANYHVERIAGLLQKKGLRHGDFAAICAHRTSELPILLLAIMACGATYVPLDPSFPLERRMMMMEDSNPTLLLCAEEFEAEMQLPEVETIILNDDFLSNSNGIEFKPVEYVKDQLAYVLFTSGSTGRPKGVKVKHQSVINLLLNLKSKFEIGNGDHLLALTTISFDISVLELFLPLLSGAAVHIATKEEGMDPSSIERAIQNYKINFIQATPATWELLYTAGWKGNNQLTILCGGEALNTTLASRLIEGNKCLWNLYGPTETTIWSTIKKVTLSDIRNSKSGIISIGKPVANTKVYVVDNSGNPSPLSVPGELWIGGDGVSAGYILNPELTAEKFVKNPWSDGMIYKTGDRVVIDKDGDLNFLNRNDNQVKIRGYRIELGEIESSLNSIDTIQQAVVIARKNNSGSNYLVAYVILKDKNSTLDDSMKSSFKQEITKRLPDYMFPTSWVQLEKFPLTLNDKIDRKALPEPNGQTSETLLSKEFNSNEKAIAELWKELLEVDTIELDSDFFELGGHSLLAVKMVVDLEQITGIKLPLSVLFTNPTIRQLAKLYEKQPEEKLWNPLVIIKESGTRNPLYFAHGVSGNVFKYHMLANLLHPDQPSYGLQAVGLNGVAEPFNNMEEMAAYHIQDLLKFQPKGPYALAGGSFGGYLALEMAHQMKAMGHEVNFLCLLDIEATNQLEFLPTGIKQIKSAQLLTERFIKRALHFIKSDKETKQQYLQDKLKQLNQENDVESWLDKHKITAKIGEESAAYFKKVEAACYNALVNYKLKPYSGDVILIRAKEGYFNNTFGYDLGWKYYVNGNLQVEVVSGDHNSIFWEPNVTDLAKTIETLLAKTRN